jgi:class 3 adenylate cyclase
MFDRRGSGASDGVPHSAVPTWEDFTEDVAAVLDAVGSKQTAILASIETGPMAILFAATHPQRVDALVLANTYARYLATEDYPIGVSPEALDWIIGTVRSSWGTPDLVRLIVPTRTDDVEGLDRMAAIQRFSATPRSAAAQYDYILRCIDVRDVLSLIQVPTLVLHSRDNLFVPFPMGRYLVDHIDGAKLVEFHRADIGLTVGDLASAVLEEITEFLIGQRPVEVERILATVLFTDIADSTAKAASLGDRRWRILLDAHDRTVREQLRCFRGREINTTGDGFVASFDGPARAIRCARAIVEANQAHGIQLRVGMHTGECEVRGDDLGGLAVNIAARVGALAPPGEVVVSGTVKDLVVGSDIEFDDRGEHELKGVPGSWKLFAVRH